MAEPKYVTDFINEMTPYAVAVGEQYGIDPVTIITQAAVETGWGREVAGNNYFGVKSHGRPGGQNITTHEEVGGKRVRTKDSFRTYGSLEESVADYGRFLSENPRYTEALKQTGPGELQGIADAGYATDSNYSNLIRNVAGMVQRNIQPIPPGEIPNVVASRTDTVPPRATPPVPVLPSRDVSQRRTAVPSTLVADSFGRLPQPRERQANAADLSAMDRNSASPFLTRDGQGVTDPASTALFGSKPDYLSIGSLPTPPSRAPTPAPAWDRITARNTALPEVRKLPALPIPPRQSVANASDRARGNSGISTVATIPTTGVGQPPSTRNVQSVPVPPAIQRQAALYANGGPTRPTAAPAPVSVETIASIPTVRPPTEMQRMADLYSQGGPTRPMAAVPDRLTAGQPGMPALYGDFSPQRVASIGVPPVGPNAPIPFPPYRAVGTELSTLPPMPRNRPNTGFMPPMPIPRPMPRQTQAPLRIVVNGGNVIRRPLPAPPPKRNNPDAFGRGGIIDGAVQPRGTLF